MAKKSGPGRGRTAGSRRSQFTKGQSGNPKGRPKQTKNFKTDLQEELQELVVAHEGDRTVKISKQRAMIKSVINRTIKGDVRAATTAFNSIFRCDPLETPLEIASPLTAEDEEVLARVKARFLVEPECDPIEYSSTVVDESGSDQNRS